MQPLDLLEREHRRDTLNAEPRGYRQLTVGIELDQPPLRIQLTNSCLITRRNHTTWSAPRYLAIDENQDGAADDLAANIIAAISSGCPAKTLALHLPHLASMAGRNGGKRLIAPHLLQATRFSAMLLFQAICHSSLHPANLTAPHRMPFAPERWRSLWRAAFNYTGSRHPTRHVHDIGLRRSLPLGLSGICNCCDRENRRTLRFNEHALDVRKTRLDAPLQRGDRILHFSRR